MSNVASTFVAVFDDNIAIFGNNVADFGNNVERNFVLSTKSKQIEHCCQKRQQCRSNIQLCRKDEILQ